MSVIATAELTVDTALEPAFHTFIDFSSWDLWMPPDFRPISGPSRELREGDRLRVLMGLGRRHVPATLQIIRLRPDRELCWRAGVPGLLVGEHSFFFRKESGKTALRSEEPMTGLLTLGPLASSVERVASQFGARMLAGFAAHLAKLA